jgi:TRAP-type C4-dicarboxylate transport system permease small subunit
MEGGNRLKRLLNTLENFGAILMGIMVILVVYQVITRYIFSSPPPWTEELARYFMVWSTLIISAVLVFEKDHINMDYFVGLLPKKLQKPVNLASNLILTIFMGTLFFSGIELIQSSISVTQKSPGAGIPMYYIYTVIPFAAVLMFIAQIRNIIKGIREP